VTSISGTKATKLLWPENSIPSTFTVCSVTRYTSASGAAESYRNRILQCYQSPSQSVNWVHGHADAFRGSAYYGVYYDSSWQYAYPGNKGVRDDWLVMCGTNAGAAAPGNLILDQDEIGAFDGGLGSCRLNIGYWYDAASDFWLLHSLLIWDYSLGAVPALWHPSATLSPVLLIWFFPWCDLGMRRTVFSGQGDWGR
jgi:hypothetical protein